MSDILEKYNCETCNVEYNGVKCNGHTGRPCPRILKDSLKRMEAFSHAKKIALEAGDKKEYEELNHLYYCGWSLEDARTIISKKEMLRYFNKLENDE